MRNSVANSEKQELFGGSLGDRISPEVPNAQIDFIGIGSAKSGTSWLARCLEEHPQIDFSKYKSNFFFNSCTGNAYAKDNWSHYDKGIKWYLRRFPPRKKGHIRGEFGVSYLHDPKACERIAKHFPNTKILVILRNPVDMVYSLYWYARSTVEIAVPPTFEDAVEQKLYLDRGKYYKYLKPYYDRFPAENIKVLILEEASKDPQDALHELYQFLGVDTDFAPDCLFSKENSAISYRFEFIKKFGFWLFKVLDMLHLRRLKNMILDTPFLYSVYKLVNVRRDAYPRMAPDLRKTLLDYYKEDIKKLENLLEKDLSLWK